MPTEDEPQLKRDVGDTGQFRKDLKRVKKGRFRHTISADLKAAIALLADDKPLPTEMRDHALTGDWKGSRDCHLRPDLVLIYEKVDPERVKPPKRPGRPKLILERIGSHSELGIA